MKNLYDVLEVSKKASKEIIEKAYKTLAKKYHPDVQEAENKAIAEEKMKEINEAYSILIDEQKRKEYDEKLFEEEQEELEKRAQDIANNQYNNTEIEENFKSDEELKRYYQNVERQIKQEEESRRKEAEIYRQNYIQYMKSLGYKFKKKFTMKDFLVILITIIALIVISYILWIIPPIHDWMVNLYNDNFAVKLVVNIIMGIVKGIGAFFSNLFKGNK